MSNTLSKSISTGITFSSTSAYQSPLTITSTGTVAPGYNSSYNAAGFIGIDGSAVSGLTLINDGVIKGGLGKGGSGGAGVQLSGVASFSNTGVITGEYGGFGAGNGANLSGSGTFSNSGRIIGGNAIYGANGVDLSGSGSFTNTGIIAGGGDNAHVYDQGGAGVVLSGASSLYNSGTIIGGIDTSGHSTAGIGIYLNGGVVINAGLISGGTNYLAVRGDAVLFGTSVSTLIVESGATFTGNLVANATVSDVLAIGGTSSVDLIGVGAQFQNFHSLAFEVGSTGAFAGSLTGLNNDSITGFTRGDGFYVNGFSATTSHTTISAVGILAIAGASAGQTLDLTFTSAAIGDVLDLTTAAGGTSITIDPHILNNQTSNGITLTPAGAYQSSFTITSTGIAAPGYNDQGNGAIGINGAALSGLSLINEGVINGGAGNSVSGDGGEGVDLPGVASFSNRGIINAGYGFNGGVGIGGSGFTGLSLINDGAINGGAGNSVSGHGGAGVDLLGVASFQNSGFMTGGYGSKGGTGVYGSAVSGLTLINGGVIDGGAGSRATNGAGGAAVDLLGAASFSNSGTITGGGGFDIGNGVDLSGAGSFSNSGMITGGGGVQGAALDLFGSSSFSNTGTIDGSGSPGGTGGTGVSLSAASTFSNSGMIAGGNNTAGIGTGGAGANILGASSFSNSGTITGGNNTGFGAGGAGVDLSGASSFSNSGTISGGSGGSNSGGIAPDNNDAGFYLNGGVLINEGLIAGGTDAVAGLADSVQFGSNASTLVVDAGARFVGSVIANASVADVLAIGGTTAVDLSGVGVQFTNFHTLAFETGSTGSFAGSLSGLNNDVVAGFGRGDGFYIDGFAAASTIATIGAGGLLAVAGTSAGQTLDLTFASAAIGDVLDLGSAAGGTSLTIDPHILNNSTTNGITLTSAGVYQSSFTITSTGSVTPSAYGAVGVEGSAISGLTLINQGAIKGGVVIAGAGTGGAGVDLSGVALFSNSGTIAGGYGNNGGVAVDLAGSGSFSNSGYIVGGTGRVISGAGVVLAGTGIFTNNGTITGGNGQNDGGNGVDLMGSGSFINNGTIIGGYGAIAVAPSFYLNSGQLTNAGLIEGGVNLSGTRADAVQFGTNAGTLVVESGASFIGNVVANVSAPDVLAINGSSAVNLAGIGTQFQNFHALAFDSGSTGTVTGNYAALESQSLSITGFTQGDTIILDGFGATSDTYVSGVGLELSNGTSSITIDITGSFATGNFSVIDPPSVTTISLNAPCFAQGTKILTQRGEIPVENLTLDDHVILHGGGTAPIRWIGHRTLSLRHHPHPEQARPIRIEAGALLDGIPRRDLFLSPDHALYLNGALIPAKTLLNGSTIRQEAPAKITYFHIELSNHSIIYAEGTPTESYLETGNRGAFTNSSDSLLTLHPNFAQTRRERESCAPFTESGPLVEAVRACLLARANHTFTTDPALTLQTNPDGSVAIISRSAIPGQLNPDPRDQRRLGVKIAGLEIGGAKIPLDHPDLTEGWHITEPDGRWTNGRSVIPAQLAQGRDIRLELAGTTRYELPLPTRFARRA